MAQLEIDETASRPPGFTEMARQHRAVRLEMVELRGMIDSCPATQRSDGFRAMLSVLVARLRDRLTAHFELEEERVRSARRDAGAPVIADALERFARDHAALAVEGARLSALLRAAAAPPNVVAKTMQWIDELRAHEQAEDGFLAAYNHDDH